MGAGGAAGAATIGAAAKVKPAGSDLGAIEHVIFFMQENRSFDHYYGAYKGVRGFDDHPETVARGVRPGVARRRVLASAPLPPPTPPRAWANAPTTSSTRGPPSTSVVARGTTPTS